MIQRIVQKVQKKERRKIKFKLLTFMEDFEKEKYLEKQTKPEPQKEVDDLENKNLEGKILEKVDLESSKDSWHKIIDKTL